VGKKKENAEFCRRIWKPGRSIQAGTKNGFVWGGSIPQLSPTEGPVRPNEKKRNNLYQVAGLQKKKCFGKKKMASVFIWRPMGLCVSGGRGEAS